MFAMGDPGLKTVLTTFFFCFLFVCFFVSPQLILQFLQRVSNGYFKENYNFPRFQRGPTFAWGYNFFQGGGPNAYFYRNPYNL